MADNPKPPSQEPAAATDVRRTLERVPGGLDRIRDILFGEILSDLDKRLARIDHNLTTRGTELAQDARRRTDVLEAHVRKELDAQTTKTAQTDQRIARLEERIDSTLARIEREVRQQLLDQAKAFQDELARMRNELRFELVRELGIEGDEQGNDRGSAPWASHH
jgi:hypothetical protein